MHLSLIQGISARELYELLMPCAVEKIEHIYEYTVADFVALGCLPEKAAILVAGLKDQNLLQKELLLIEKHQVQIVTMFCLQYSFLLKQIHVPPVVLYCQGDINLLVHDKMIACVGARKAHLYVYDVLKTLIAPMVCDGWVIVSGGALGADTYAHLVALQNKGKTIAVVGSGLCYQYPSVNKKLFEDIVKSGGLIVSIFKMQTPPEPYCFPVRNRIIGGLSVGCVVLQAASKSGALITAQCALQQNREVFAVPGSILDPLSAGCHELIQQGAKLVTKTEDILQEMPGYSVQAQDHKNLEIIDDESLSQIAVTDRQVDAFERAVLQYTVCAMTFEVLQKKLNISFEELRSLLFALSLDGKVKQDESGLWKRI